MQSYQIMYWHDIPIQVRVQGDGGRVSRPLPDRFQDAIDRAAMLAGVTGEDAYLEGFRWGEPVQAQGDAEEILDRVIDELERQHPIIAWQETARRIMGA